MNIIKQLAKRRTRRLEQKREEELLLKTLEFFGPSICYEFGVDPKVFELARKRGIVIKERYAEGSEPNRRQ